MNSVLPAPADDKWLVLKACGIFLLALFLAGYAWSHGGWLLIITFLFVIPLYFVAGVMLAGSTQYSAHKYAGFLPSTKTRWCFWAVIAGLVAQNLVTPVLGDGNTSIAFWSIFTGYLQGVEPSAFFLLLASIFFLITNIVITIAFIVLAVLIHQDIAGQKAAIEPQEQMQ